MFETKAKVTVKNAKGEVVGTQEYNKRVFEGTGADANGKPTYDSANENAISQLLADAIDFYQKQNPKGNGVVDLLSDATYAYDLGVRAGIRQGLVTALAGPDKAIEKQIKDFMATRAAMGKPVTEAVARERVMAMLAD